MTPLYVVREEVLGKIRLVFVEFRGKGMDEGVRGTFGEARKACGVLSVIDRRLLTGELPTLRGQLNRKKSARDRA